MSEGLPYFFASPLYIRFNSGEHVENFQYKNCRLDFVIKDNIAHCPYQSSFGAFSGQPDVSVVEGLVDHLKGRVREIRFGLAPLSYPQMDAHLGTLLAAGFRVHRIEVAQWVSLRDDLEKRLHPSKKKKLKADFAAHVRTQQLALDRFSEVYQVIKKNREHQGHPMTIGPAKLESLVKEFPNQFQMDGTFFENQLVAASVSIDVGQGVLYHFLWGHLPDFDCYSPLVFHHLNTAKAAKTKGFAQIDIGVSSVGGVINRGLYRFKKQLGAQPSKKYHLIYTY